MEKTSFEALPEDMKMEILSRLPLKSLMRFICVSKNWATIIRGKEFRDVYLHRSMKRPRVLFVANEGTDEEPIALLHSVYQEEEPLLSSGQQRMRISSPTYFKASQPIRGLICLNDETKVVICNPGTKKTLTLPRIRAYESASRTITTFFGYDGVTDVFKVLSITAFGRGRRSEVTKVYEVFTVGSGEESWRRITCRHHHSPTPGGLCKGGVLYYGATSNRDNYLVTSFNVRSEEFGVIELPEEVHINRGWKLVNYEGKFALANNVDSDLNGNGVFEIWVWNGIGRDWWRNPIVIPRWKETVENMVFYFRGTIGTREFVFTQPPFNIKGPFVLYYDTVTQNLRRFKIEGVVEGPPVGQPFHTFVQTFLDHVDSPLLCEEQELVH